MSSERSRRSGSSYRPGVRRGGAAAAAVALGVLSAPAVWAGPAPSAPPAPRPADGGSSASLGGWTVSASAAPITMEIYDPKIPIPAQPGQPNLEFDLSFTRASYGSGPTGAATASWLWPGDAIAFGLGQLFNNPGVKYPILTNVQFPGATPDATMQPIPGSYMQSHTDANGSTSVSTFGLPLPGTGPSLPGSPTSAPSSAPSAPSGLLGGLLGGGSVPPLQLPDLGTLIQFLTGQAALVDVQGERSQTSATVTGGKAVATAESDAGKLLLLGGLIEFDGLKVTSQSTSDGVKGTSTGNVDYGSMSVAGVTFGITANGIQTPAGLIALPQLPDAVNQLLAPLGISIALPAASDVSKDTAGEMFSHGLQVTIDTAKLKAMLPLTPVLTQLFAQIPPDLMKTLTQGLPPTVTSVINSLPQLAPKIVLTIGSAKSKADASQAINVSGGSTGGPSSPPSSSAAGSSTSTSGGGTTAGTTGGGSGTSGTSGGSTGGTVGGGSVGGGTGGGTVGGGTTGGGTTGGSTGGATGSMAPPNPPMQNTASKMTPAAFGGLPGQLLLGAAVVACVAAWGLRKYSTLLFGGAGCEAGHTTGVPDLREFEE
ncbi:hypothetical protein ABH920_002904 [Catenulispora sp. EB89]|uniref:choice-of-anchor P family protein n=1 Tax=Catenulispora sp. EB89 TaxID=3156257 RepID=UPI00351419B4